MVKSILGIGAVIVLTAALLGGGAYLLLRDSSNGGHIGRGAQPPAARSDRVGSRWCEMTQSPEVSPGNGHEQGAPWDFLQAGRAYRRGNPDAGEFRAANLSPTAP